MVMPSELEQAINMGASTEELQRILAQQGQPYNPEAGHEQGRPMFDSRGKFLGYDTGERVPIEVETAINRGDSPEEIMRAYEDYYSSQAVHGRYEGQLRYYGEQQARARQELGAWEKNLKKESPELFEVYRKGGRTTEARIEAYNKEIAKRQATTTTQAEALSVLEDYKVKVPGKEDAYLISKFFQDREKDIAAATAVLKDAGFTTEQIALARVEAFRSPLVSIGPAAANAKPPGYFDKKAMELDLWMEKWKGDMPPSDAANLKNQFLRVAGGGTAAVIGMTIGTVLTAGKVVFHPTTIPSVAKDMYRGVVQTASSTATGMYKGITGGAVDPYDLAYNTTSFVIIAAGAKQVGGWAWGKAKGLVTYIAPRGIPASNIAIEASTGRIKVGNLNPTNLADSLLEAEKQAMKPGGPSAGEVPIEGTAYSLRWLKTPLQEQVGNLTFHGAKDGLSFVEQGKGTLTAGKGGIYTDPWAALQYARGKDPGLVMIITDTSLLKPGGAGLAKGLTQSGRFIERAKEGYFGPSKTWKGDLEPELVGAPGTKNLVPKPTADLSTRLLAGRYSDFFTYDAGKYVPIKLAIDKGLIKSGKIPEIPTIADLYAAKLLTLKYTLRNTGEAFRHPKLMLEDLVAPIKAIVKNPEDLLEGGSAKGGRIAPPGVRDVYLIHHWGTELKQGVSSLLDKAMGRAITKAKAQGIKPDSPGFERVLTREMELEYATQVRSLLAKNAAVVTAYNNRPDVRSKFETIYVANLSSAVESLARSSATSTETLSSVSSDVRSRVSSEPSPRTGESPVSSRTFGSPETPRTPESPRSPRTPESPRTLETPQTPEIPRSLRTPEVPEIRRIGMPQRSDATDKEKREYIRKSEGAITFRMGELHDKDVWHVIVEPYLDRQDYLTVLGDRPRGTHLIRGPGSAYKTAQMVYGPKLTRSVSLDIGITDVLLEPMPGKQGVAISFKGDPHLSSTSDINISKRVGPITKRTNIRITPKFQRLS